MAMDIDSITPERKELLDKRACFNCKKPGHFAAACYQKKNYDNKPRDNRSQNTRYTPRSAALAVNQILKTLSPEDEEKAIEIAEKLTDQDFQ